MLPHVPADWGPPEVTQVLTQSFDDITLIHHRRTGREQLYRFRGKHKFGDRDIVPLQVQLEEDGNMNEITMWATIAPVKTPNNKQTWLRNQAVPLIEPKPPALKVAPVKAPQAQAGQESGETQQPTTVRAVSHRQLPAEVRIDEAPKDGSCFYHSMAKGLQWLTGKSYCHRDLRARANQHIEKHLAEYLPEFDGQGPSHEKLREEHPGDDSAALKAYLKLAACESAYASNLEIKALSRLYNVCIVVVPRDPRFGILTFKESRRAKTIALWLTPKHVDLLLPVEKDAKYPAELFTPSPGQIIDLRAGGRPSGGAASRVLCCQPVDPSLRCCLFCPSDPGQGHRHAAPASGHGPTRNRLPGHARRLQHRSDPALLGPLRLPTPRSHGAMPPPVTAPPPKLCGPRTGLLIRPFDWLGGSRRR